MYKIIIMILLSTIMLNASVMFGGMSFNKIPLQKDFLSISNGGTIPDSEVLSDGVGIFIFGSGNNSFNSLNINKALKSLNENQLLTDKFTAEELKSILPQDTNTNTNANSCYGEPIGSIFNGLLVVDNTSIITERDNGTDMSTLCVSNVTNMSNLFKSASAPYVGSLSEWDVSHVLSMANMFNQYGYNINDNWSKWNVSNVQSFKSMFSWLDSVDININISSWDISGAYDLSYMFYYALNFSEDISSWDISHATNMKYMLSYTSFNSPVSNWNNKFAQNSASVDLTGLFSNTRVFNQPVNDWDISKVTSIKQLFNGTDFNQPLDKWGPNIKNLTDLGYLFTNSKFNQDLSNWDVSNISSMKAMFMGSSFNQDISNWDTSSVTNMYAMFYNNSFFDQDISTWNVANVTNSSSFDNGTLRSWTTAEKPTF